VDTHVPHCDVVGAVGDRRLDGHERPLARGSGRGVDEESGDILLPVELVALSALEQDEGQKLGGKSAEAARFITAALARLIEDA
jgi:hypothetical protein